jgi:hypothetical protein
MQGKQCPYGSTANAEWRSTTPINLIILAIDQCKGDMELTPKQWDQNNSTNYI